MSKVDVTKMKNNRDPLIDCVRGIAVLGVLAIHTAFWSGSEYVPDWFQSLTLLVDVPLFFFVSGWGSGLKEMGNIIRQLDGLWKNFFGKAVFCVIVCVVGFRLLNIQLVESIDDFLKSLCFSFSFTSIRVLPGSLWFVPYYVRTIVINGGLICCVKPYLQSIGYSDGDIVGALLKLNVILFLMSCAEVTYLPFGLDQTDYFYNIMWLFGAYTAQKKITISSFTKCITFMCACVMLFFASGYVLGADIVHIQNMKFPIKTTAMIPWLFYSLICIMPVLYVRSKALGESKIISVLSHLGKKSIFYFFAQGISSSFLYKIPDLGFSDWWIRFCMMFVINVGLAVVIAECLSFGDKVLSRQQHKIKNRICTKT